MKIFNCIKYLQSGRKGDLKKHYLRVQPVKKEVLESAHWIELQTGHTSSDITCVTRVCSSHFGALDETDVTWLNASNTLLLSNPGSFLILGSHQYLRCEDEKNHDTVNHFLSLQGLKSTLVIYTSI